MKKLLVVPILLFHYLLMAVLFPIEVVLIILDRGTDFLSEITKKVLLLYQDYILEPTDNINYYARNIMSSDKIIKQMREASNKLKRGKPID